MQRGSLPQTQTATERSPHLHRHPQYPMQTQRLHKYESPRLCLSVETKSGRASLFQPASPYLTLWLVLGIQRTWDHGLLSLALQEIIKAFSSVSGEDPGETDGEKKSGVGFSGNHPDFMSAPQNTLQHMAASQRSVAPASSSGQWKVCRAPMPLPVDCHHGRARDSSAVTVSDARSVPCSTKSPTNPAKAEGGYEALPSLTFPGLERV